MTPVMTSVIKIKLITEKTAISNAVYSKVEEYVSFHLLFYDNILVLYPKFELYFYQNQIDVHYVAYVMKLVFLNAIFCSAF